MRELPHLRLYRLAAATALILAPGIFLVDNLLHPKEYPRDHEAQQLARIADDYTRWQVAHALGLLTILMFAAAVLGLAFLVRRRQPGLGLVGGALGILGLLGSVGVIAIDGYTWGVLGKVSGEPGVSGSSMQLALHEVQQSGWSYVFYSLPLLWIAGLVVLAIGVALQRAVSAWAAALLALGSLLVGIEAGVGSNAYFIVASAVLFAGGIAVGHAIARMSDEAFAEGGVARGSA
jgi:hypothetical protein